MSDSQGDEEKRWGAIRALQLCFPASEFYRRYSVRSITKSTLKTRKKPTDFGVDDLSLGPSMRNSSCRNCGQNAKKCPGHFGHIALQSPCFHPNKIKQCHSVLKIVCPNCSRLYFPIEKMPESDPRSKTWNQIADQTNAKFYKILRKNKGPDRLRELAKLATKKLVSCGIPTYPVSAEGAEISLQPQPQTILSSSCSSSDSSSSSSSSSSSLPLCPTASSSSSSSSSTSSTSVLGSTYFTEEQILNVRKHAQGKKNNKSQKYLTFGEPTAISNAAKNDVAILRKRIRNGDPRLRIRTTKTKASSKKSKRKRKANEQNETTALKKRRRLDENENETEESVPSPTIKQPERRPPCGLYAPCWINCKVYVKGSYQYLQNHGVLPSVYSKPMNHRFIYEILDAVTDEDVVTMGLHPEFSHPRSLMVKDLPVPPPIIRPGRDQNEDEGSRGVDDVTYTLGLIVKANENLRQAYKQNRNKRKLDQQTQEEQNSSTKKPKTTNVELAEVTLQEGEKEIKEKDGAADEEDDAWSDLDFENDDQDDEDIGAEPELLKLMQQEQLSVLLPPKEKEISEDTELTKIIKKSRNRKLTLSLRERELLLNWYVSAHFDNNVPGVQKLTLRTGHVSRCLKSRFPSKKGRFRETLLGKRNNQSARNVINSDPHLHLNQVSIPVKHAKILFRKIKVTRWNYAFCVSLVRNGRRYHPGCQAIYRGKQKWDTREIDCSTFVLRIGDYLDRDALDDDLVLFNRQPSLHRASIQIHRLKVTNTSTFNFHHGDCGPYNADCDGDEMNMTLIQNDEAFAEAYLMMVQHQILSPRHGRPIIGFVQDSVLGAWLLTDPKVRLSKEESIEFLSQAYGAPNIDKLRTVVPSLSAFSLRPPEGGEQCWTGLELLSMLFPPGLYVKKPGISILHGMFQPDSANRLGSEHLQHLVYAIVTQYGDNIAADFITAATLSLEWYLYYRGTTVSLEQCMNPCPEQTKVIVKQRVQEANDIIATARTLGYLKPLLPSEVEEAVTKIVDGARADAGNLILDAFDKQVRHGPKEMTDAKSKGNAMNLTQISAVLGQQNQGGRMLASNSIYSSMEREIYNVKTQGMIERNFTEGLAPLEYYFHAMCGRAGVVDTAVKTGETGYMNRRMDKGAESLSSSVDGTTRSAMGSIVEFRYGDDNFNPQYAQNIPLASLNLPPEKLREQFCWD